MKTKFFLALIFIYFILGSVLYFLWLVPYSETISLEQDVENLDIAVKKFNTVLVEPSDYISVFMGILFLVVASFLVGYLLKLIIYLWRLIPFPCYRRRNTKMLEFREIKFEDVRNFGDILRYSFCALENSRILNEVEKHNLLMIIKNYRDEQLAPINYIQDDKLYIDTDTYYYVDNKGKLYLDGIHIYAIINSGWID